MVPPGSDVEFELGQTLLVSLSVGAVVSLSFVLLFRAQIDRWAFSRFLLSPWEDSLSISLRSQQLEQKNAHGRNAWAMIVATWISIVMLSQVFDFQWLSQWDEFPVSNDFRPWAFRSWASDDLDLPNWFYTLTVVPCALATSSAAMHAKYGWLNQVIQVVWLVARFGSANSYLGSADQNERMLGYAAMIFIWNEFALRSLSMLLVNHILVLTLLPLIWHFTGNVNGSLIESNFRLQDRMHMHVPVVSAVMIVVFCYRRYRPNELNVPLPELRAIKSRCAQLLSLLLQSDAITSCRDNVDILSSALGVLTNKEHDSVQNCQQQTGTASRSEASTAGGTGTGAHALPEGEVEDLVSLWFDALDSSEVDPDLIAFSDCIAPANSSALVVPRTEHAVQVDPDLSSASKEDLFEFQQDLEPNTQSSLELLHPKEVGPQPSVNDVFEFHQDPEPNRQSTLLAPRVSENPSTKLMRENSRDSANAGDAATSNVASNGSAGNSNSSAPATDNSAGNGSDYSGNNSAGNNSAGNSQPSQPSQLSTDTPCKLEDTQMEQAPPKQQITAAPLKRSRARQSCTRCRKQKLKCSGEVPCVRCVRRNEQDTCELWHRVTKSKRVMKPEAHDGCHPVLQHSIFLPSTVHTGAGGPLAGSNPANAFMPALLPLHATAGTSRPRGVPLAAAGSNTQGSPTFQHATPQQLPSFNTTLPQNTNWPATNPVASPNLLPHTAGAQLQDQRRLSVAKVERQERAVPPAGVGFDALAQLDVATRSLIWFNESFGVLVREAGEGDSLTGFQRLTQCFLGIGDSCIGEQYNHKLGILSTVQKNNDVLMWALQRKVPDVNRKSLQ